jgi:hypothetical protein
LDRVGKQSTTTSSLRVYHVSFCGNAVFRPIKRAFVAAHGVLVREHATTIAREIFGTDSHGVDATRPTVSIEADAEADLDNQGGDVTIASRGGPLP